MKSLFWKNFITYSTVIILVFVLFVGMFVFRVDRYAGAEKQRILENSAERAAEITSVYLDGYLKIRDSAYKVNISQIARDNGEIVIICDQRGNVEYFFDKNGAEQQSAGTVGQDIMKQVMLYGKYTSSGQLDGILKKPMKLYGTSVYSSVGVFSGAVFTAAYSDKDIVLLRRVTTLFTYGIALSIVASLTATYFITLRMTVPLKNIATAAKQFAKGDFSTRLDREARRKDEIGQLAVNFNNMAVCLENNEELRRGFIANVSHDLKTPMTTASGFIDGILDGTIPQDKQREYLTIVSDEIKRLSRLADTMLEMSKLESGNVVLSKSAVDLCEMTRRIVLSFEQLLNKKNADVDLNMPDMLVLRADRDSLFRVIYNLTDNAVKFLDDGGKLRIKIEAHKNYAEFKIGNTGQTIPKEDIPFVFDRFYKADRSRGKNSNGSGLGLFIVKSLINMHDGKISVDSSEGYTEFCIKLPTGTQQKL